MDGSTFSEATYNLETKANNLIHALQVSTIRVASRAAVQALDESQPEIQILCAVLEHIAYFRMKSPAKFFGSNPKLSFWRFLKAAFRNNSHYEERLKTIEAISTLSNELAKERAYLRSALVDKSLADTIVYLTTFKQETVRAFYCDTAFFSSSNSTNSRALISLTRSLMALDFNFDIRFQAALNAPTLFEIDYTALEDIDVYNYSQSIDAFEALEDNASQKVDEPVSRRGSNSNSPASSRSRSRSRTDEETRRFNELEARLRAVFEQNVSLEATIRENRAMIVQLVAECEQNYLQERIASMRMAHAKKLELCEQKILELQLELVRTREQHARSMAQFQEGFNAQVAAISRETGGQLLPDDSPRSASTNAPSERNALTSDSAKGPRLKAASRSDVPDASLITLRSYTVGHEDVLYVETQRVPPVEIAIPSPRVFAAIENAALTSTEMENSPTRPGGEASQQSE